MKFATASFVALAAALRIGAKGFVGASVSVDTRMDPMLDESAPQNQREIRNDSLWEDIAGRAVKRGETKETTTTTTATTMHQDDTAPTGIDLASLKFGFPQAQAEITKELIGVEENKPKPAQLRTQIKFVEGATAVLGDTTQEAASQEPTGWEVVDSAYQMTDAGHQDNSVWLTQGKSASSHPKMRTSDGSLSRAGGRLRGGSIPQQLEETNKKLANITDGASIKELSPGGRLSLVKNLNNAMDDVVIAFAQWEPQDFPMESKLHLEQAIKAVEDSKEARDNVIGYIEMAANGTFAGSSNPEEALEDPSKEQSSGKDFGKGQRRRAKEESGQTNSRSQGRSGNSGGSGSYNGFDFLKSFQKMMNGHNGKAGSHGHRLMYKRKSGAASLLGRYVSRESGSGRRRRLAEGGVENKYHMCLQLAECVTSMSLYDTMAYFKSDDIDEASGTVDDNRVVFDEVDLLAKYQNVGTQADNILAHPEAQGSRRMKEESASELEIGQVQRSLSNQITFCQSGTLSAAGGTCCDPACTQCGGANCTGQCCTDTILEYCTDPIDTGCKAPTEIKLSIVEDTNCTIEVWPGTDASYMSQVSDLLLGIHSFYSLLNNSSIGSLQVRVVGEDCSSVEVTRLELVHRASDTDFKAGEFNEGLVTDDNPPHHGHSLELNHLHTFDFQAGGGWADHYWEASSIYDGPPTMAPTFGDFCTTGVLGTYQGDAYCCDSDCLVCGGGGCEDRGGNHDCCPETIDRPCAGSEDTGCIQTTPTDSPSQAPSSYPTQAPTVAMDSDLSDLCNNLLQEFHRTTEDEMVPKWEGATVGQVCLAEGTQVQVKLAHAAVASADVTDFVENTLTTIGAISSGSQWADEDIALREVAVASNNKKLGLDARGRMYKKSGSSWVPTVHTTPFSIVDRASSNVVAVDANGELFKYTGNQNLVQVGGDYVANRISVGRDGTAWGVRTLSATNRLCLRDGTHWSCTAESTRVCTHDFVGVSVGDKDHIYLWTDGDMYRFEGWKDGQLGVAECDDTNNLTFKRVPGQAKTMSVAVNDAGQEAVYLVGTDDHIYVLNQENKYQVGSGIKIANNQKYRDVSSDGNGRLWAIGSGGTVEEWQGSVNYDTLDWSNPPSIETNQFVETENGDKYYDVISVAANGDVCFIISSTEMMEYNSYFIGFKFKCKKATASGYESTQDLSETAIEECKNMDLGTAMDHIYFAGCTDETVKRRTPSWSPMATDPGGFDPEPTHSTPYRFNHASVTDDGWVWAIAANDKRMWRAYGTNSFTRIDSGGQFHKVSAISQNRAFTILDSTRQILETTTSGTQGQWTYLTNPTGVSLKELAAAEDGTLWAVSEDHDIYRFQEGADNTYGEAWKKENTDDDPKFVDVAVGAVDKVVGIGYADDDETVTSAFEYLGIDATFQPLAQNFESIVETYAQEILNCAAELFFDGDVRKHAALNPVGMELDASDFSRVALASNGRNFALDLDGKLWWFSSANTWRQSSSAATYTFHDIDAASSKLIGITETGELLEQSGASNGWVSIHTNVRKASVTDDGWIWIVSGDDQRVWKKRYGNSTSSFVQAYGTAELHKLAAINETHAFGIMEDDKLVCENVGTTSGYAWKVVPSPSLTWKEIDAAADGTVLAISVEDGHVYQLDSTRKWTRISDRDYLDIAVGQKDEILSISSSTFPWRNEKFVFGEDGLDPRIPCSGDCDMSNYRIPIAVDVCEPDPDCARDEFGQLINNEHESAGFVFKSYNELLQDYEDCTYDLVAEFDGELTSELEGIQDAEEKQEKFDEVMAEFVKDLQKDCIGGMFGDKIDSGLELVFGKTASPGFICGMKEAINERGHTMPGYCCLDAPYQLEGDAWGHPFDCESATPCTRVGPYFAGLDTEACDAHGGTWCPLPTDCGVLVDCIQEGQNLYGDKHPAYANYLSLAPRIRDATDSRQCGRVRQYFGFDEFFLNDQAICDEIEELRFSKDFSFMDEFFGSGGGKGGEGGSDAAEFASVYEEVEVEDIDVEGVYIQELVLPEVPTFDLGEVKLKKAKKSPAEDGQAWRATNFAVARALDIAEFVKDQVEGPEMTCEAISGVGTEAFRAGCFGGIVVVKTWIVAVIFALRQVVEISEFTYGEVMEQGNEEPWEMFDRLKAIEEDMTYTGKYIKQRAMEQNKLLKSHHKLMGKALKDHHKNIGDALEDHHNNIGDALEEINSNVINGATLDQVGALQYDFDHRNEPFDVQVEVATNADTLKQVLLIASLDGVPLGAYDTMVNVKAVNQAGALEELAYDGVPADGDEEEVLVTLPKLADDTFALLYRFQVTHEDYNVAKTYKQTKLVSFGHEQPARRLLEEQMIPFGNEKDGSMDEIKVVAKVEAEVAKVKGEVKNELGKAREEMKRELGVMKSDLSDVKAEIADLAKMKDMLSSLLANLNIYQEE